MTLPKGFKPKVNKKEKGDKSTNVTVKENNNNTDSKDIKVAPASADDFINKQENKIVTDNVSPKQEITIDDIRVDEKDDAIITAVTTTPTPEGEVQSETELRVPLQEKDKEVQSETELNVMSSYAPPLSSSLTSEDESHATFSPKSTEDYPQNKNLEEREKMQNIANHSDVLLDEIKNNIGRSIDESRSQIPRYTQIINESQEQVITSAREIADNYIESQKEIINSLQSLWTPFAENMYKIHYGLWISPRKMIEVYSRIVSNFADTIIAATRLVNNTAFANMEVFKTSIQQAKDNAKDLTRIQINAARIFEQSLNNSSNINRGDPEQIPKEDVSGEVEKVISEQGGIEGQRKEVNVESYSKTASLGQILKDLDFPANKDKILQFVQRKNLDDSILPSRALKFIYSRLIEKLEYLLHTKKWNPYC
ncbi:MAG TPA: DUF2795 domain-containing protein, partial [Nitrososphaeraceae archaeon]|nr:DUF2795 domain-containing protein [Nitrososphaeraceae archaeon]